jgi:hypothetical protein
MLLALLPGKTWATDAVMDNLKSQLGSLYRECTRTGPPECCADLGAQAGMKVTPSSELPAQCKSKNGGNNATSPFSAQVTGIYNQCLAKSAKECCQPLIDANAKAPATCTGGTSTAGGTSPPSATTPAPVTGSPGSGPETSRSAN